MTQAAASSRKDAEVARRFLDELRPGPLSIESVAPRDDCPSSENLAGFASHAFGSVPRGPPCRL